MSPPQATRAPRGRAAEDRATAHLLSLGHDLLARNWRGAGGELDLITREGHVLVFTEVKHRTRTTHGSPLDAVTPAKITRVLRAAEAYMLRTHGRVDIPCRLDVITIEGNVRSGQLVHLQGVAP